MDKETVVSSYLALSWNFGVLFRADGILSGGSGWREAPPKMVLPGGKYLGRKTALCVRAAAVMRLA